MVVGDHREGLFYSLYGEEAEDQGGLQELAAVYSLQGNAKTRVLTPPRPQDNRHQSDTGSDSALDGDTEPQSYGTAEELVVHEGGSHHGSLQVGTCVEHERQHFNSVFICTSQVE